LKEGTATEGIIFITSYHSHVIAHRIYYIYHYASPFFLSDIILLSKDIYELNLLLKGVRIYYTPD
jgi:hypothetical protein